MPKLLCLSLLAWLTLVACGPTPTEPSASPSALTPQPTTQSEPVIDGHTSENALDWAGTYSGVLPCADCEGIETSLTLSMDHNYQLSTRYIGKDEQVFQQQGKFEWDAKGAVIQLLNQSSGPARYKVGENQLVQLDMAGELITGSLAENYILSKQQPPEQIQLSKVRWKLTELMGQAVATTEPDMTPYLEFGTDNRVSGFSGCNQFTGAYEITGLRLTFKPFATTEKACLNGSVEQQFLSTLQGIDNFTLQGSDLAFYKARTAALARFSPVQAE